MNKLKIACLGRFQASFGEAALPPFRTSKVQALLIYLAVEAAVSGGTGHRREALMELLWPEQPLKGAQQNLRQTLYQLRKAIPDQESETGASIKFIESSRITIGINPAYALELDAAEFGRHLQEGNLEAAVALYRGDFLADFYLPDSSEFESWAQQQRSSYLRQASAALDSLTVDCLQSGREEQALSFAQQQLTLDDLNERAHRQVMEALARLGRREAALAQYEACRQILEDELGVETDPETEMLLAQIQSGELRAVDERPARVTAVPRGMPQWKKEEKPPLFVGRDTELTLLASALERAGRPQFIIGGAGRGKTALVNAFTRQALAENPDLLVLSGYCRGPATTGEPYLPFRHILAQLTGDVGGPAVLSREQAEGLWKGMPETIPLLVENGPDLVNALLSGGELRHRAATFSSSQESWFRRLCQLLDQADGEQPRQDRLFSQVTSALRAVSGERPLLLILEDLHWTDAASAGLLMHLCLELAGSRILLLGTYRPEEVHTAGDHPLAPLSGELKRQFGDIWIDLGEEGSSDGRRFIDAYLDAEPNDLDERFREKLFDHTGGHALFTVELLRAMQERGEIAQNEAGRWQVQASLIWDELPAKVEGVIEQRFGRLDMDLQEALSVAAVEGETFTAAIVAEIQGLDERRLVRRLSREVERQHRLVEAEGLAWSNGRRLACYRFRHQLFQQFLYNELPESERIFLHEAIGLKLEEAADDMQEQAAMLAWHFDQAGMYDKAVPYLLQAGDAARLLYASDEAVSSYERAITILKEQGDYEAAARVLMKLGLAYSNAFDFEAAQMAYDESFSLQQRSRDITPPPRKADVLQTFRIGVPYIPDPHAAGDFPGLVKQSTDYSVRPDVARSWQILDGGTTYLFHLRDDVFWSDGRAVTVDDFVFAWHRVLDPGRGSLYAETLYDIDGAAEYYRGDPATDRVLGIEALDDYTIKVKLNQPAAHFLQVMTSPISTAVPRHVVEVHGDAWLDAENIVSSGPFLLQSWHEDRAVYVRNKKYHGEFTGNVESVEIRLGVEKDYLNPYEQGKLDALNISLMSTDDFVRARQRWAEDYRIYPRFFTEGLRFNTEIPPFDDPRARRAIVLATDRKRLAREDKSGRSVPATGGFLPPGMPGHMPDISLPFDSDEARRLLAEAGYPEGENFPILNVVIVPWQRSLLSRHLADEWQEILGVTASTMMYPAENFSWETYYAYVKREKPHIAYLGWAASYVDPDSFLRVGLRRIYNWQHEEYDALIKEAGAVLDQDKRLQLFRRAEEILVQEAPILPIQYSNEYMLVKPWVRNYRPSAVAANWHEVIIESHDALDAGEERQWPAPGLSKAPHALRTFWTHEISTLDLVNQEAVNYGLFPCLVQLSADIDIVPDVARRWEILDDGHTYLFHLRDDVFWSDGQPVTAGDFVFALRRALHPEHGSYLAENLYDIAGACNYHQDLAKSNQELGIEALDDSTLKIRLVKPIAYFLQILATTVATAVPRHAVQKYGDRWTDDENIVCCGPFLLQSNNEESMILRRYLNYHGQITGNVESVEIRVLSNLTEGLVCYDEGEFDIIDIGYGNYQEFCQALRSHSGEHRSMSRLITDNLVFNVNKPPFDDPKIRRAFVLATDRQLLLEAHEYGRYVPATGGFIPPGMPGHMPGIALPFDPLEAQRLLTEAGYPEGENLPVLNVVLRQEMMVYHEYILKRWQEILGVRVEWSAVAWPDFFDQLHRTQPHISNRAWGPDYLDPDNFLRIGLRAYTNWHHEVYEELIGEARNSLDHAHRLDLFRQAEEILVQEAPILPLLYLHGHVLVKPWIKNFQSRPWDSRPNWHRFIIEPH